MDSELHCQLYSTFVIFYAYSVATVMLGEFDLGATLVKLSKAKNMSHNSANISKTSMVGQKVWSVGLTEISYFLFVVVGNRLRLPI